MFHEIDNTLNNIVTMLPPSHKHHVICSRLLSTRVYIVILALCVIVCVVCFNNSDPQQINKQVFNLSKQVSFNNTLNFNHSCPVHAIRTAPLLQSVHAMNILVTGGAGYIGAHMTLLLLTDTNVKHNVVIIDNLSRGSMQQIHNLQRHVDPSRFNFVQGDIGDETLVYNTLIKYNIDTVIHFAGYAYASESVHYPLVYYNNIVTSTNNMLQAMSRSNVTRLVFSSSSAVYGSIADEQCDVPLREDSPTAPSSPYGDSKLMAEHVIHSYAQSQHINNKPFNVAMLRYFNVIGSDKQLRVGPLPKSKFAQYGRIVDSCFNAAESGTAMSVYGSDYSTVDGSAVRDYIHVSDLVDAHYKVIQTLHNNAILTYNVGIGQPFSVQQIVAACRAATNIYVSIDMKSRRLGDPPLVLGDPHNLVHHLKWKPQYTDVVEMIETAWQWRLHSKAWSIDTE